MVFKIHPVITVYEPLLVAYPIGPWDRQEFLKVCKDLNVEVKEADWAYGLTAYQFENLADYTAVLTFIYTEQALGRWNK